jgi:ADP-ribosylglycohydrolase
MWYVMMQVARAAILACIEADGDMDTTAAIVRGIVAK